MMRRAIIAAAALLVASACSSGASSETSAPEPATTSVDLPRAATVRLPKSYRFAPDSIEVAEGAIVTWVNEDDFPHTVRLLDDSGVDEQLGVGRSTSITFEEPGVYRYDCSLHPTQMEGTVTVREVS